MDSFPNNDFCVLVMNWIPIHSLHRVDIENDADCELCNSSSNTEAVQGITEIGSSLGFMCVCASDCVCVCVCVVCMCVSMCRACSISPSDGEVVPSTTATAPTRTMVILLWATDAPNTQAQGHAISKQQDNTQLACKFKVNLLESRMKNAFIVARFSPRHTPDTHRSVALGLLHSIN